MTRRNLFSIGAALTLLVFLAWLPFGLGDYRAPNIGAMASIVVSLVAVLGYFGSIAALILWARDLWRGRARLLTALKEGTVIEFEGIVSTRSRSDSDFRELVEIGALTLGSAREQRIAVLATTHQVIHRDRKNRWRAIPVEVRSASAAPIYAMRVPVPPEFAVPLDPSFELVRRSLSSAEKDEIEHYIRQIRRDYPRLALNILLLAACAWWLLSWLSSPHHRITGLLGPLIGLGFTIRNGRSLVTAFRQGRRLSQDLATGWVLTLRPRCGEELQRGDVAGPSPPRQEFLGHSTVVWTENGRPASWRHRT